MRKLVGIVGGLLLCVGLAPAPAMAQETWEMRQAYRAAKEFVDTFSVQECQECIEDTEQRQSRGATGSWEPRDYRCNKLVEIAAAFASMWSMGANLPADLISVYCAAADLVEEMRPIIQEWRDGPYDLRERRMMEKYDAMTGPQRTALWQITIHLAEVSVGYMFTLPPYTGR